MLITLLSILASTASATVLASGQISQMNPSGLSKRQQQCAKVTLGPAFCQRSCGPQYVACNFFNICYDPSKEQCCDAGSFSREAVLFRSRLYYFPVSLTRINLHRGMSYRLLLHRQGLLPEWPNLGWMRRQYPAGILLCPCSRGFRNLDSWRFRNHRLDSHYRHRNIFSRNYDVSHLNHNNNFRLWNNSLHLHHPIWNRNQNQNFHHHRDANHSTQDKHSRHSDSNPSQQRQHHPRPGHQPYGRLNDRCLHSERGPETRWKYRWIHACRTCLGTVVVSTKTAEQQISSRRKRSVFKEREKRRICIVH